MIKRILVAALLIIACLSMYAEGPCGAPNITVGGCLDELAPSTLQAVERATAAATERAAASEQADVSREATGSPAIESAAGNALRDFLSIFAAAVQTANLSEEGDALTLDWNMRMSEFGGNPIKFQGVFRKPVLWEPFATTVTSVADRDKLLKDLDDFDDVTVSVTWSPESAIHGRLLDPHRPIFDAIMRSRVKNRFPAPEMDELDELVQRLAAKKIAPFKDLEELDNLKFDDIEDVAMRELVREKVIAAGRQTALQRKEFDRQFKDAGLDRFSDLLNNQPQLYFSASTRERNPLVGPRDRNLKLTYEKGFANINTFRQKAGRACEDGKNLDDDACAQAFADYISDPQVVASMDAANRVALSIEHSDLEDYDIAAAALPSLPNFHVDGSRKWNGSFTYGRVLHQSESMRDGRIDISLTYEDVKSDDPKLDSRWIGSAIYTQKLTDTLSLPLGIVWASHKEDVPDSDRELSAHFGLIFKIPKVVP